MKTKRLKINWEELEDAFNRQKDDMASYLDRITGHVVMEGEGEESDLEDEQNLYHGRSTVDVPAPRKDDATRMYIRPPGTARKIKWLKVFLDRDDELDAGVKNQLHEALTVDDPAEVIGEILRENFAEREAWFLFRAERVRELIDEWLTEGDIEPVNPPPWRT
jgi:hypothetical protein